MRGLWLFGVIGIGAVAFVGWNATDAAESSPDPMNAVLDECAVDVQACARFLRRSIGKHHRQNVRAGLLWAPPTALCTGQAAGISDEELVRLFVDWGERRWRRVGGALPAHQLIPLFLREELGCP